MNDTTNQDQSSQSTQSTQSPQSTQSSQSSQKDASEPAMYQPDIEMPEEDFRKPYPNFLSHLSEGFWS